MDYTTLIPTAIDFLIGIAKDVFKAFRSRKSGSIEVRFTNENVVAIVVYTGSRLKVQVDRAFIDEKGPKRETPIRGDVPCHPVGLKEPFDGGTKLLVYIDPTARYGKFLQRKFRFRVVLATCETLRSAWHVLPADKYLSAAR